MKSTIIGNGNVTIDGKTFSGRNIQINNSKVIIDGVVQDGELVGDVNITVEGDVESIENSCGNVIARNVGDIKTASGRVKCEVVGRSVVTVSGDVNCGNVEGSVKTASGDVECKDIKGSVNTVSGDICRGF